MMIWDICADLQVNQIYWWYDTHASTLFVHDIIIYQWTLEFWFIYVLKIDCRMLVSIACHSWHYYMLMILKSSKLLRNKLSWRTYVCLMLIKQLFVYDYLSPVLYIQYQWGMNWHGVEFWRRVVCAVWGCDGGKGYFERISRHWNSPMGPFY